MYIARAGNPCGSIPYSGCPSDPVFYLAALFDLTHSALYKRHGKACNSSCFYGADIVQSLRQGARANPKVKIVQGLLFGKVRRSWCNQQWQLQAWAQQAASRCAQLWQHQAPQQQGTSSCKAKVHSAVATPSAAAARNEQLQGEQVHSALATPSAGAASGEQVHSAVATPSVVPRPESSGNKSMQL